MKISNATAIVAATVAGVGWAGSALAAQGEKSAKNGEPGWAQEVLPDVLFDFSIMNLSLWQWIALMALVVLASGIAYIVAYSATKLLRRLAAVSRADWDDELVGSMAGPARLLLAVFLFFAAVRLLELPEAGLHVVTAVCKVVGVIGGIWLFMRVTDVFAGMLEQRFDARGEAGAKTLVPLGRRVTKVFIAVVGALSLLQNLGFNVAGLLAGLGIGGLAIALAAQKTLENVFGGFMVIADHPVRVGDFCRVGDHIGTVEDIGLRSSRIRTLDRTLVTIPNAEFSTARIENFAVRDRIRLFAVIQVGYETTPDQMRYLLVELRKMLYAHPRTLRDPCRVRFVNFGAYSLDLEFFVYIDTKDFNEFLSIREDIYLRVMDIVAASGTYFAFPSQTLYLGRHAGLDEERTSAAQAAVAKLREAEEMPLPDFPPEQLQAVENTLPYPPPGSASRRAAAET